MGLTIAKILITILVVVTIAEVSKRIDPFFGGILMGLPFGVGLATYFISYAQGVDYFVKGIPWGLAGLAPAILFFLFYLIGGRIFRPKSNLLSMLACSAFGCGIFFLTGYLLRKVALNLWGALLIFVAVYLLNIFIVGKLRVEEAGESAPKKPVTLPVILVRGLIAGVIVSILTGVASLAGSEWAGILSAFPSTAYPLLLVLHFEYKKELYPSVIYGLAYSMSNLAFFYVLSWFLLPRFGLNVGFVLGYVVSIGYLFVLKLVTDRLLKKTEPQKAKA